MIQDKALVLNLTNTEESVHVLPHAPILSSQQAGWNGIFLAHYQQPAHETPEHRVLQHVIAITDVRTQARSERRMDGQFRSYLFGNGEISLTPANVSHWGAWDMVGPLMPKSIRLIAETEIPSDTVVADTYD